MEISDNLTGDSVYVIWILSTSYPANLLDMEAPESKELQTHLRRELTGLRQTVNYFPRPSYNPTVLEDPSILDLTDQVKFPRPQISLNPVNILDSI